MYFRLINISLLLVFSIFFCQTGFAQEKISGIVTGPNGEILSGASITVKGTAVSTVTKEDGSFSIAAKKGDILIFSFVGYISTEIKLLSAPSVQKVALKANSVNLDEVILTGYTYQKVKEITGSISSVKPKDLTAVPAGQVERCLRR